MRRNKRRFGPIAVAAALLVAIPAIAVAANTPAAAASGAAGDLDGLRRKCIAAARAAQQLERTVAALEHDIELMRRDADGRQRGLDDSRVEQAQLLGEIERFARHPPAPFATVHAAPLDRLRGELLRDAVVPALRAEARALAGEIERVAALRGQIDTKQRDLGFAQSVLAKNRDDLAKLIAQRVELAHRLVPVEALAEARVTKLRHEAKDLGDLIKRADAATDRHDKELAAHARAKASASTPDTADPTRPHDLRSFEPSFSVLTAPVSGPLNRHFADDAAGTPNQGLTFTALRGGEIVAPFDGRAVYAGPLGDLGLGLIIRHGALYHSLLAGLGRVDLRVDDWVVAGEPVGAMPEASGSALYFELRREGRPVDPEPWLADHGEARPRERDRQELKQQVGDRKVTE